MLESIYDLNRLVDGDWIVHIVPEEDDVHPAETKPCVLFIRTPVDGQTYYYSFTHPDSVSTIDFDYFLRKIIMGMKHKIWAIDKKAFDQLLSFPNVMDANLVGFLSSNFILELRDYETSAHQLIRGNSAGHHKVNLAIPLLKHKEAFDEMADDITDMIKSYSGDLGYYRFNSRIIGTLGKLESQGIFVDRELFKKRFDIDPGPSGIVHSQYNVYTSTGRPSNRYGGVNYAALNHTDGTRKCFCSRYGKDGKIVVVDYTAFHPRIICTLTNYPIPVDVDIYEYLAKLYFQKKIVDETDISNAKKLTFRQLYGGVEEKYAHIRWLGNLKAFIDEQWTFFQEHKYVETSLFKRHITDKHITDPNPAKLFNYLLQAAEGEVAIPKIKTVMEYLKGKKTKVILYVYDSILLDFHKDDGYETLQEIRHIMSYSGIFPMKTYLGDNYHDIKQIPV